MADPNLSSFIWSVADSLRGDYKQSDYGKVILPFIVLRRMDCVLEKTKQGVLAELAARRPSGGQPGAVPAQEGPAELLQHVSHGHEDTHGRPGPHQGEPVQLHPG